MLAPILVKLSRQFGELVLGHRFAHASEYGIVEVFVTEVRLARDRYFHLLANVRKLAARHARHRQHAWTRFVVRARIQAVNIG